VYCCTPGGGWDLSWPSQFKESLLDCTIRNCHFYRSEMLNIKLGEVVHSYNPSIQDTEVGGLQIRGQPGLYSKV
jgi:hypothetical protein